LKKHIKRLVKLIQKVAPWAYVGLLITALSIKPAFEFRGYWGVGGEILPAIAFPFGAFLYYLYKWQESRRD
jgi:hypothetical protein